MMDKDEPYPQKTGIPSQPIQLETHSLPLLKVLLIIVWILRLQSKLVT
jgi:hypothetical protein